VYVLVFILKRLLSLVPVLLIVATLVFAMTRLTPGDPAILFLGDDATPESIAKMREQLNLDQPLALQFFSWLWQLLQGNLGRSIWYGEPVWKVFGAHVEVTLLLAFAGFIVALLIGVPSGVAAAIRHGSWLSQGIMILATIGMAVPEFWLGLNLVVLFSVTLKWLPSSGYVAPGVNLVGSFRYLLLPAVAVALKQAAYFARMTRSSMLDVLKADYVRTARSKGLHETKVIWKHAFSNVSLTVLTVTGLVLGTLVSGALVVETVFALPGLGSMIVKSINNRDYAVIQAAVMFIAVAYALVNLITDVLYVWVDPRVEYE